MLDLEEQQRAMERSLDSYAFRLSMAAIFVAILLAYLSAHFH
jgi:hypothetical protein